MSSPSPSTLSWAGRHKCTTAETEDWKRAMRSELIASSGKVFSLPLQYVALEGLKGACKSATVHLFLDDTTNWSSGIGNTLFIRMTGGEEKLWNSATNQNSANQNSVKTQNSVCWNMMGAVPPLESMCTLAEFVSKQNDEADLKTAPMPDTFKVVVTAETQSRESFLEEAMMLINQQQQSGAAAALSDAQPFKRKYVHGTMGGAIVPMEDMLKAFEEGKAFSIPIFNSFMGVEQTWGPKETVEAMQAKSDDTKRIITVSLKGCPRETKGKLAEFHRLMSQGVFCKSRLPGQMETDIISHIIPGAINRVWVERVDQGLYAPPSNAPASYKVVFHSLYKSVYIIFFSFFV